MSNLNELADSLATKIENAGLTDEEWALLEAALSNPDDEVAGFAMGSGLRERFESVAARPTSDLGDTTL